MKFKVGDIVKVETVIFSDKINCIGKIIYIDERHKNFPYGVFSKGIVNSGDLIAYPESHKIALEHGSNKNCSWFREDELELLLEKEEVMSVDEMIEDIKDLHDKNKCLSEINFRGSQQEKIIEDIINKEMVNSPKHYNQTKFECIDEMIIIFGLKDVITWCKITAYKYKHRAGFKDDKQQDLNKCDWYLTKTKELKEREKKGLYFKEQVKVLEPITIEELEEMGYELVGSGIKK